MCSGHGSARAWARSNKREGAHLVVVVVRPGVAGAVAGEQRGGRRGSGEWRVSSVGHQNGRDRSHSNGKTTAERMGVAAEAVVAGVERHGLDGEAERSGANGEARAELRDALSRKGSAP